MTSVGPLPKRAISLVAGVCVAAVALRLALAFAIPNIAHPDQIFQTMEQAHRLAFGYGIVPWEFREGVRSWLLPGFFALLFKMGDLVLPIPGAYLMAVAGFLALLSLSPVVCGFLYAYQVAGVRAAFLTAGFIGVWFELVYFATKPLSEVVAAHVLLAGLYLAFPGASVLSRSRLVIAGLLLGLSLMLRIQLLPAIAVVAVYACWVRRRQPWRPLALGFVVPLVGSGVLDWATWGHPWQSVWKYVYMNSVAQRSEAFGVHDWYYYALEFAVFWSAAVLPMVGLIWLGARRVPLLAAVGLTILISHSLIGHKEYRFIYPAIAIFVVLAGIGLSDVVASLRVNSPSAIAACLLVVTCASAVLARQPNYRDHWAASEGEILAFREIAADPHACGVLLWRQRGWTTPGYTGLHRDIPIYEAVSRTMFEELSGAGNYVVTRTPLGDPGEFRMTHLFPGAPRVYLYYRPGACSDEHRSDRLATPDWYGDSELNDR